MLLADINNGTLRDLANKIPGSPKTVNETLMVVKQVIKSTRDPQTGAQLYPLVFDHEFIDAPTVKDQKQPCATVEQVNTAIRTARSWQEQLLMILLAGTGIRISEALAIRVGPEDVLHHNGNGELDVTAFLESEGVIRVRSTIYKNTEYASKLKTAAAKRDVDLDPRLAPRIAEFIRAHKITPGSFLFQSETGDVMNLETATRRLRTRKIPGFHSFRRFRITHLRQSRIPEDLVRYWAGHSAEAITDRYDKAAEDMAFRKHWSKQAGLGFDLQALGSPKRERKHRPRIERMFKSQSVPRTSYKAVDQDLPGVFFKEACVG